VKPLLWKEMRDLGPWILGAGALLLVLRLLCLDRQFAEGFPNPYGALMPVAAFGAAIALGAGSMARERASKTLDFLLARPIAPGPIVWIKFLTGSVALAMLVISMAALCFIDLRTVAHFYGAQNYRAVGYPQTVAIMFPRFWCMYALTFLFSTLVDRTAKAVVAGVASVLALAWLIGEYGALFPFSNIGVWQPFWDFTIALRLVHDPALFRLTGIALCALALLVAQAASALLRRSPGWTLRNRTLILGAAAIAGLAVVSTWAAGNRLPVLSPVGSMGLASVHTYIRPSMGASRGMVAVAEGDWLRFLDFTDPTHPHLAAEAHIPLWETHTLVVSGSQAYILGTRKALPSDEVQVAIASPGAGGSIEFGQPISLGTWTHSLFPISIAVAGHFLYLEVFRGDQFRIEAYDLSPGASGRQTGAVVVEKGRPMQWETFEPAVPDRSSQMRLQGQFLYVTTPSALTTIDLRDPGRPVAASRIPCREPVPNVYYAARDLASDGHWLLEAQPLLHVWNLYDLADPAHPALRGRVPRGGLGPVSGTGPVLFESWRGDALEFRAAGGGLEALHFLTDGHDGQTFSITAADGYVYTVKRLKERRIVYAYRVSR